MERQEGERLGGRRRQYNRLTAKWVANVKAPGLYADGACLYLLVGRTGSKSWVFRYWQHGRPAPRDMGLGALHTFSLKEAREKARECRQLRDRGGDPIEQRRAKKQQAELERAKAMTFKQCAEAYIAAHRAGWKTRNMPLNGRAPSAPMSTRFLKSCRCKPSTRGSS